MLGDSTQASEPGVDPSAADLPQVWGRHAAWQIRMRWLVPPLILAGTLAARWLGFQFAFRPVLLVGGAILMGNAILHWLFEKPPGGREPTADYEQRLNVVQVSMDYAAVFLLVYLTGGPASPFMFFFIFHVIFAAILFPPAMAWLFAAIAAGGMALMAVGAYTGWLTPDPLLFGDQELNLLQRPAHLAATVIFFGATVLIAAASTAEIMRRLRLANRRAYETVQSAMRQRTRFMLEVAHNIRSPLTASVSLLELVSQEYVGEITDEQREYLDRVSRRLKAMNDTVGELLALARSRDRKLSRKREPVDLGALAGRAERTFQATALRGGVALRFGAPADLPAVTGDPELLQQLLDNLISNAVKYTPPGGRVDVRVSREERGLLLEVRDTGIGIPPDEQPRLFTEFFRATNARSANVDGSGLGLAIAKEVVDQHAGRIDVASVVGEGTAFRVWLPLRPEAGTD